MVRGIFTLVVLGLMIYALVDCLQTDANEVRALPKPLWILVIAFPLVGPVAWLVGGRAVEPDGDGQAKHAVVVAPDDDPDFLHGLDQQRRARDREKREQERRRRREASRGEQPDPGDAATGEGGRPAKPGLDPKPTPGSSPTHPGDPEDGGHPGRAKG